MRVRVLSLAIDEIAEAALWLDSRRTGLGAEFWRSVEELFTQIESNPFRFGKSEFATSQFDIRFAIVRRFNYVIHFAIDQEEVQIVSVAHAARKPGYWLRHTKK